MQNKGSLHNKFEGFGAQPSDNLWNSIASNLDQKKKKRVILFWWLGSSLAAVVLLFIVLKYSTNGGEINITENTIESLIEDDQIELTNIETEEDVENLNLIDDNSNIASEIISYKDNGSKNIAPKTNTSTFLKKKDLLTQSLLTTEVNIETGITSNRIELGAENDEELNIDKLEIPLIEELGVKKKSNLCHNEILQIKPKLNWMYSFKIQSQKGFDLSKSYTAAEIVNTANNNVELDNFLTEINAKTFRPLTLRFGLAKKLNNRFSFQTGIDLGWIQTNSTVSKSSIFTIGLPIKLNLTLIERKRGVFYTDFGLINELPFFERTQILAPASYGLDESKFVTGFLGGTELGLGFNYKLNENFKFDVNSGFKWYYYQGVKSGTPITSQNVFLTFNAGLIWNY